MRPAFLAAAALAAFLSSSVPALADPAPIPLPGFAHDHVALPMPAWDEHEQAWRDPASSMLWWAEHPGWVETDGLGHYWWDSTWHWRDGTPYRYLGSSCYEHPDRFNWPKYAQVYDWPLDELAYVIHHESRGDLCAVNSSSGATCWIQQLPGGPQYFDPATCMSIGYAKWVAGGRSFWQHWFQWW